jgi:hypothetical protein
MQNQTFRFLSVALFALAMAFSAPSSAFATATIVILNNDGAGEGFNDPTAVAPVGGNTGTTLGQQRLIAFQAAADIWGATITSALTITIQAQFDPQTCTATTAVLGSAGADGIFRDFTGAPFAGTWYGEALANKLSGVDQEPDHDINATFNSNLGQTGCLDGTFFYLGLDNNHGTNVDLISVLLHEFAHGLGFQTFTNGSTGAPSGGFPSVYDRFLVNSNTGKSWLQMTNAERAASAISPHKLAWNGPQVSADVAAVTTFNVPILTINAPPAIAGIYSVTTANFGPGATVAGVTGSVIQALDAADAAGPTTFDGCSPFTNAAAISGNIALVDRGTCTFKTKALNAQNAGATALVIVNNVAGAPPTMADDPLVTTPITITSVQITMPDGDLIKGQLGTGVNGTVGVDANAGDPFGKALLFSPSPIQTGSSVSHWDQIASPSQLMEPAINGDLTHNVTPPSDLTFSQFRDIGWLATALPNAIVATTGNNQSGFINTPFAVPFSVTISPAVAGLTVTFTANPSAGGANGTFGGTGTRFATATTNAGGVATAPVFTANGTIGDYTMNATVPGAGTAAFSLNNTDGLPTPTPSPSASATPTPTPAATATATPTPAGTATPTVTPNPVTQALNLSTRLRVLTGDNAGIAGFIITGSSPKTVLLRAIGPSLAASVPGALADPTLELHGSGGFVTVLNNNWQDDPAQALLIQSTGIPPTNDLESAIYAVLPPGVYSGIIRGNGDTTGVGLIELYDVSQALPSRLANISTRAFVNTGDEVVIAGFILGNGSISDTLVLRGIGPSLPVPNPLADPTLELRNGSGTLIAFNDNYGDGPPPPGGLQPMDPLESLITASLPPGAYSAILAGNNNGTGIGLIEAYDLATPGGTPGPTATPGPTSTPGATATPGGTATPAPTATPGGGVPFAQSFDGVTAPALPAGWVTSGDGDGTLFATTTTTPDTAPNCVFIADQNDISDKVLDTPSLQVTSGGAVVTFRLKYDFEFSTGIFWDGMVLEVSSPNVNGGVFTDVTDPAAGGVFNAGGYNCVISQKASNPLGGRSAWGGNSGGYQTVTLTLGAILNGQTIKLRYRVGTDEAEAAPGASFDTITSTGISVPP